MSSEILDTPHHSGRGEDDVGSRARDTRKKIYQDDLRKFVCARDAVQQNK